MKHRATDAIREVPIPPQLVEILRQHIDSFESVDGRIFSNAEGRPVTAHNYGKVWRRERDKLWPASHPCSTATTYDLRHTAATVMLQAGVSPAEAARRLGHSVDVLMRVYAGVFIDERERSNARIDRILEQKEGCSDSFHTDFVTAGPRCSEFDHSGEVDEPQEGGTT